MAPEDFDEANRAMNEAKHWSARIVLKKAEMENGLPSLDGRALARKLKFREDLRWFLFPGQFGGVARLGSDPRHAAA